MPFENLREIYLDPQNYEYHTIVVLKDFLIEFMKSLCVQFSRQLEVEMFTLSDPRFQTHDPQTHVWNTTDIRSRRAYSHVFLALSFQYLFTFLYIRIL